MLTLLFYLAVAVASVVLYCYLNDKKLARLPPEAAAFSPSRFTPKGVLAAAEDLSRSPIPIKEFLPPKTGRRYIVVGGAGFLGGWIVLQLLERGEDPKRIRVLDIRPPSRRELVSGAAKQVAFFQVDVSNATAVLDAFKAPWPESIDANDDPEITVFHTAANIRFYEWHLELLPLSSKVNHQGTVNVINASQECGISTLVYTSSASISVRRTRFWLWPWEEQPKFFVQVRGDDDSHLPKQHDHFFSNYAASKILAEKAVRAADKSPSGTRTMRTGCVRPGNGIFGHGGDLLCGAYLVRKDNPTWNPNILQSFIYVENCALAHLCYEQRLIELEKGSSNPDIGGQAFTITDAGPPITFSDVHTALSTLDPETIFPVLPLTLMLGISHIISLLHVNKTLLSTSSSIGRAIANMIPAISGDMINLQPSIFALTVVHLIFDDSRARRPPAQGGLGYNGPYTTLQGLCKTADDYHKSGKAGEERSLGGGVSFGFKLKRKSKATNGIKSQFDVKAVTALN